MAKEKKRFKFDFLLPVGAAAIALLMGYFGLFLTGDNLIYDMYLHVKPPVEESDSILLVDVDDLAISKVGVWPWSRHIMGDGLITMKEFNARYAIFDIEYTEDGPLGVNSQVLNEEIPEVFSNEFGYLSESTAQLAEAVESNSLPPEAVPEYLGQLNDIAAQTRQVLLREVQGIARDNDAYLGNAAHFFKNSFFTVNMLNQVDEDVEESRKEWARENLSIENAGGNISTLENWEDIRPPVDKIIQKAEGAGFVNIIIDDDGVRRRVHLLAREGDTVFGQLAFTPLLHWLGDPAVTVSDENIVIENAEMPDGEVKTIRIPRTPDGPVLINWPPKTFTDSFRHLSYYYLVLHREQEDRLIHNLRIMNEAGYLSLYRGDNELLAPYDYAEAVKTDILSGGDPAQIDEYRETRGFFFQEAAAYLEGPARDDLLDQIDGVLAAPGLSEEDTAYYTNIRNNVADFFHASAELSDALAETREILTKELNGAYCLIGHTGTSTTDRGVNPFEKEYDNVGTHASVANMIIQNDFLQAAPWWISAVIALLAVTAVFFSIRNLRPGISLLVGFGYIFVLAGGGLALFIITGMYVKILTPLLGLGLTFVGITIFQFLSTAKEKTFIHDAFGKYLSASVVDELLKHPEKLSLGGEKRFMTAIFTDIKGFSTISEHLDPTDLVSLLNRYLTRMSDILLSEHATIDKYEGDAIISFFGAPIDLPDHAERACRAAIRMKEAEAFLNNEIQTEGKITTSLHTRIGINTGDMVVGNMGTSGKMDYTIMGNAVNLAARLEGVNKQYGTMVLMSEITYENGGEPFISRQLDRVRVVGIGNPVRLYELIGEKGKVDNTFVEALEVFHQGLELFEQKAWVEAKNVFQSVLEILPEDGPSQTFLKRCEDFEKKPPKESWDGVFSLTTK